MKKILIYQPKLNLPLPLRGLLFLAVLAIQSVEVPAQDTATARIPRVNLIPVHQREVMHHYINTTWDSSGCHIDLFDGKKESTLTFDEQTLIEISPNQYYFTVAKPLPAANGRTVYKVELRNVSNVILAKGRSPSLGSEGEEGYDSFLPSDDGLSVIQKANLVFSGGLHFVFLQQKSGALIKRFEVDKTAFWNATMSYEPTQKMIVAIFIGRSKVFQTHVQCYSSHGTLQWETTLDSQFVRSRPFISKLDGTIAFVSQNVYEKGAHNYLFLFRKNGEKIRQVPVHNIGSYEASSFRSIDGKQYFLSSSGVEYYYIIDTENGDLINRLQTQDGKDIRIMGLCPYQGQIFTTYYTFYLRPGPNNTHEPAPKDQGLGIMDLNGQITYVPLKLTGIPFLLSTRSGLFLRDEVAFFRINSRSNFYKIEIK